METSKKVWCWKYCWRESWLRLRKWCCYHSNIMQMSESSQSHFHTQFILPLTSSLTNGNINNRWWWRQIDGACINKSRTVNADVNKMPAIADNDIKFAFITQFSYIINVKSSQRFYLDQPSLWWIISSSQSIKFIKFLVVWVKIVCCLWDNLPDAFWDDMADEKETKQG